MVAAVGWYNRMLCIADEWKGVYQCPECGLMQRFELPEGDACPPEMKSGKYTAGEKTINQRMRSRLDFLERTRGKGLLLDVGAGTGSFVDGARQRGWDAVGVERPGFNREHCHVIRVDLMKDDLPGYESESFHVLHMNHVLEHVEQIQRFLQAGLAYLRPDGVLILEVPNEVRSLANRVRRVFGMKYRSRTAFLGHWNFFDKQTLRRILEAQELDILRLRTPAVMGSGGSAGHRLFDRMQSCLGMGSVIEVVARKRG